MARVVITLTDSVLDGTVECRAEPAAGALYDRVKTHGAASLSPSEAMAVSMLAHVLQNAGSVVPRLIT